MCISIKFPLKSSKFSVLVFLSHRFEADAATVGCGEPVVGVPEYPVSLLGETGHHGSHTDFDATMAQIDIEDFHSEDILLRLPPLCASDLQVSTKQIQKSFGSGIAFLVLLTVGLFT